MSALTKTQYTALVKKLKDEGNLTASGVVKLAKNPKSPLHTLFEWNDTRAAKAYRLDQARKVIKQINVKAPAEDKVIHVPAVKGEGEYKLIADVVACISDFELALSEALKILKSSERMVSDLRLAAQKESPETLAYLAVALKGLNTAEAALNQLH